MNTTATLITPELTKALHDLDYPAKPVEGRGNVRCEFPLLNNKLARSLWLIIPACHKYQRNYGGVARFISPEAERVCVPVLAEIKAQEDAKWKKTVASWNTPKNNINLPSVQRDRDAAIVVNVENLAKSELTVDEQVELTALLNGAHHPIQGRALTLKNKSGLTWGQIQA